MGTVHYFSSLSLSSRVAHERLARICFVDCDRVMALWYRATGQHQILGGRLIKINAKNEAEVAILVSDQYQKQRLGIEVLRRTVQIARDGKLSSISAEILRDNLTAQHIFKKVGFRLRSLADSYFLHDTTKSKSMRCQQDIGLGARRVPGIRPLDHVTSVCWIVCNAKACS